MQGCIDAITASLSDIADKYVVLPAHPAHFCNAAGCTLLRYFFAGFEYFCIACAGQR